MIDTAEKRASTIGHGLPFRLTLPWASGVIDRPARQHVCGVYAGLDIAQVLPGNLVIGRLRYVPAVIGRLRHVPTVLAKISTP